MVIVKYYASKKMKTYYYTDTIIQIIIGFYDNVENSIEFKHIWVNNKEIENSYNYL